MHIREKLKRLDQRWGLRDNRRLLIFIVACSIVPAAVLLLATYHQAISSARTQLEDAIDIAVNQTGDLLADGELLLRRIATDIDDPTTPATYKLLLRSVYTDIRFRGAGIVNADGLIVSTSLGIADPPWPSPEGTGFDRGNDKMQILGPLREFIMQEASIIFALAGRNRRIDVFLTVDPALLDLFLEIIADLELGPHGAVGFVTDDGRLLGGIGNRNALHNLRQASGDNRIRVLKSTENGEIHVIGEIPKRWALRHWYKSLWFGGPLSLLASAFLVVVFLRHVGMAGDLDYDLKLALSRDQLQVLYQPIMDLRTHRCIGAETLLRWHHPTQGMVLPRLFIPKAEKTGIIIGLTDWLIDRVMHDQPAILGATAGDLYTSVNISCVQLNKGQVQRLIRAIEGLKHRSEGRLIFEITESESIDDGNSNFWKNVANLRRHGAIFALDDFGTGYCSHAYLNRLNLDYMKIDRHFIQGIDKPDRSTVVVDSMISLGKQLGLTLIAEGIETEEQREVLISKGVLYGQGWLFSHPLPLDEYVSFLQEQEG